MCVELRRLAIDRYAIRDSKQLSLGALQPQFELSDLALRSLFDELVGAVPSGSSTGLHLTFHSNGDVSIRCRRTDVELRFDASEVASFVASKDDLLPAPIH